MSEFKKQKVQTSIVWVKSFSITPIPSTKAARAHDNNSTNQRAPSGDPVLMSQEYPQIEHNTPQ